MESQDAKTIYDSIKKKANNHEKPSRKLPKKRIFLQKYASIAAILIILIGSVFYFSLVQDDFHENANPVASEESVLLETEDGKTQKLLEHGNFNILDEDGNVIGGQKGNQLVYVNVKNPSEKIKYNTLRIPYGKRFDIQLADGSQLFLNAGSSLRYPINFSKTGKRKVFLTGEAFFKVAKDKKRPFVVTAEGLEISVLGTQFNVAAYPEDPVTNVVLVKGAVELGTTIDQDEKAILKPGQLASLERKDNNLEISEVKTAIYTAWMQGELVFRNMTFENILKKMERHYSVKIINKDADLAKEKFNASFSDAPLDKILNYFKETYGLNFIKKEERTIIINKKD